MLPIWSEPANLNAAHRASMTAERRPWWMDVVAASFLILTLFNGYLVIRGPALADGLDAAFEGGALHVRSVEVETPFAKAGLQSGDQILAVNDLPMLGPREWRAALANVIEGQPETWHVLRHGSRLELAVTFHAAKGTDRFTAGLLAYLAGILGFLLLGLFIGARRPRDRAARLGAWLFLSASASFGLLNGWAALWRQTPVFVQALLWIPEISRFVADGIGVSFFAMFPRPLFRQRWIWLAIWIPVLATLPWRLSWFYSVIYRHGHIPPVPGWFNRAILVRAIVYAAAGLVFLTISYRWRADANERRRIRVLMLGTAISLAAGGYASWVFSVDEYRVQSVASERLIPLIALTGPLAFGYAIVRHRVLDIHLMFRQGLQYALARRAVLGIVPALAAVLIVDIAVNSQEPLAGILRARGWIYAGVGALGLVAVFQRTHWLAALDRRFFREQYNSLRVLREVIDEIQQSRSIDDVAARVVARIDTALHPEFVAVMLREATIDKTWTASPFPGVVLGCSSAAPGAPLSVSPSKPLIKTYSAHVPCTTIVIGNCLFSLDNTLFNDCPALQFTIIVGVFCAEAFETSNAGNKNTPRNPTNRTATVCILFIKVLSIPWVSS